MADLIDSVRTGMSERAELPGMSLMEHLDELRKRLIRSVIFLILGFCVAYYFHVQLFEIVKRPLDNLGIALNFTHPTDILNLYLKTAFVGGTIIASPFILYQLWLFISPGMYATREAVRLPVHDRNSRPVPRGSVVRSALGTARSDQGPHTGLR
jgi:sec-independent protein translocase protein TatC